MMKGAGYAHMGVGKAAGKDKAEEAARAAISSPLLETSIDGAKGVVINITASSNIELEEVEIASEMVHKAANPEATIIWGVAFDDKMEDEMKITVIATRFDSYPGPTIPFDQKKESASPSSKLGFSEEKDEFETIMNLFDKKR